jgi:hypothetical protein
VVVARGDEVGLGWQVVVCVAVGVCVGVASVAAAMLAVAAGAVVVMLGQSAGVGVVA